MKQRKTVKIGDQEITLKELSVIELLYICHRTGWVGEVPGISFEGQFVKQKAMDLPDLILSFASDISKEEAVLLAPSEIKKLYDAFMEVNEVTFSTAKYLGIDKVLEDMKSELIKIFMEGYAALATANVEAEIAGRKDKRPKDVVSGVLVADNADGKAIEK